MEIAAKQHKIDSWDSDYPNLLAIYPEQLDVNRLRNEFVDECGKAENVLNKSENSARTVFSTVTVSKRKPSSSIE